MKLPKINTLKFQISFVSALLLCTLAMCTWYSIRSSLYTQQLLSEYEVRNKITGYLNTAAGWQAIERGYGTTIIGSGKGDSSPLFPKFIEAGKKGDFIVLEIDKYKKKLLSINKDKLFEDKLYSWLEAYGDLQDNRPRVAYKNISKYEWFEVATHNINAEFDLRNASFTPQKEEEKLLFLNNSVRSNIAKLCEYAGRERAFVGNTIASGKPFSKEALEKIQHYHSIVEESLGQLMILKDLKFSSNQVKQTLETFEDEFFQYQLLREEVLSASERREEELERVKELISKRSMEFRNYLHGISADLLKMSKHKSVLALAKALREEDGAHLFDRQIAVENLFNTFSQIKSIFAQVRILDNSGYERVRVDFDGVTNKIIRGAQLQDKSDRDYFKESINLSPGEIYTSPLDLNMEKGRIEHPYQPVIRFATSIFVEGEKAGVIVFNLLANTPYFLHKVTEREGKEDYVLANQEGFYLHHTDEEKEWGMIDSLNKSHHNIRQDYPDVAEQILSGRAGSVRLASGSMFIYKPFFLNFESDTDKFWVFIKRVKEVEYPVSASAWFDVATRTINSGLVISDIAGEEAGAIMLGMKSNAKTNMIISYTVLGSAVFVFALFIHWARNRIIDPIQKLTGIAQGIIKGDFTKPIKIKSKDEMGNLASTFEKMRINLSELIKDNEKAKKDWESTFDSMEDIITIYDKDNRLIRFNKSLTSSLNIEPRYIAEEGYYDLSHNKNDSLLERRINEVSKVDRVVTIEVEDPDIGCVFSISSFPRFNNNDEFVGTVQISRDITERKHAEEELRQSNIFNQTLVDTLPFGIDIVDGEGNVLYMSKVFESILGKKVIGNKCWSIYRDSKKQCEKCPLKMISNTKRGTLESEDILGGRTFQITHVDILYKGKEALLEVFNDITDIKCAENDLRKSHNEIELLLSSITSIIISLSPDHRISKWNKTAETTFEIDVSSVVGKPFRECDIQWDWDRVIEKILMCQRTNSTTWIDDLQYRRPDGSNGYLGITINPIENDASGQSGVLLLGRDITGRKDMEHQLVHAQKLESIGHLAAGVAHEINTPTQYIMDNTKFLQDSFCDIGKLLERYSQLLEICKSGAVTAELTAEIDVMARELDEDYLVAEIPNAINQSLEGLERVKNIVYAMKNFSHPDNENKKSIDINGAIKNTITVAKNEWKYVAKVKTDFDSSLTFVPCFPGDFNQVILNLIVNAAHAIGEVSGNGSEGMGIITISTRCDGEWAEIRVSDTGTGIPEDVRTRVFDPFFTTKEVGKGTGQGLSLVHSTVVGRHKGTIAINTEVGEGTTFIIRLPLTSPSETLAVETV